MVIIYVKETNKTLTWHFKVDLLSPAFLKLVDPTRWKAETDFDISEGRLD
jgi:hypothetical protein